MGDVHRKFADERELVALAVGDGVACLEGKRSSAVSGPYIS